MKKLLYAKSFIHSLNFFSLIFRSFSIKVLAVTSVLVAALSSVTLVRSEAAALEHDNINKDTSALQKEANKRSKENKQLFDLIKPVTTVLDRNSIASNVYKIALNVSNPVLLSSRARFISTVPSTQTLTPSARNLPPMARTFDWGIAGYDPVTGQQSVQTNPTWKNTIGRLFLADGVINSKQVTGIAAGLNDTDAVNVAQLKALQGKIENNYISKFVYDSKFKEVFTVINENKLALKNIKNDTLSWDQNFHAFSAMRKGEHSKIAFLAPGIISSKSSEAINGAQIYSLKNEIMSYFGRESGYDQNGNWRAAFFKVKVFKDDGFEDKRTYTDVASAFDAVNDAFTGFENKVNKKIHEAVTHIAGGVDNSLIKYDQASGRIAIGGLVPGYEINIANTFGGARILSGIKNGTLAAESTDAVNGSQLFVTNNMVNTVAHNLQTAAENASRYLGGGVNILEGIAPVYTVQGQSYTNIADAFGGVNVAFTSFENKVNNQITEKVNEAIKNNGGTGSSNQDSLLWNNDADAFVAQHKKNGIVSNARITALQAGKVTQSSTDAVNGSQLYSMYEQFAGYFGGGAGYDHQGNWQTPNFKVKIFSDDGSEKMQSYTNVADAFDGVNVAFTSFENKVNHQITQKVNDVVANIVGGDSLVQYDQKKHRITIGSAVNADEISIANNLGRRRILSGIKDGAVAQDSTDAVNGSQLYATRRAILVLGASVSKYFGGGADIFKGIMPTFYVGGKEYHTVADAFGGTDNSIMDLREEIEDMKNNSIISRDDGFSLDDWSEIEEGLFRTSRDLKEEVADKTNRILFGNKIDGDEVNFLNKDNDVRVLSGIKGGRLAEDSTEAVNGSQLYSMYEQFAGYFGGGSGYRNGTWTAPSFSIAQLSRHGEINFTTYDNVASAFEGVNGSMKNLNDRINKIENNAVSGTASEGLNGSEKKESYDTSHNNDDSKTINVAKGDVTKSSEDIVTGDQLWETNKKTEDIADNTKNDSAIFSYDHDKKSSNKKSSITLKGADESDPVLIENIAHDDIKEEPKKTVNSDQSYNGTDEKMKTILKDANEYTNQQVNTMMKNSIGEAQAYTDLKFEALSYGIEDVRKEARQAAAIGIAASSLRYNDTPGKLSVALGSGIWLSQSAFAVGAGYTSEDGNIRSNLSVTSSGGHWGVGVGLSLTLN